VKAVFFLCEQFKSKKGNGILAFVVLVTLTAILALVIIPPLHGALEVNVERNIETYKVNDITGIEIN